MIYGKVAGSWFILAGITFQKRKLLNNLIPVGCSADHTGSAFMSTAEEEGVGNSKDKSGHFDVGN